MPFQILGIDHLALAVFNLGHWGGIFKALGLEQIYEAMAIGTERSSMDTIALRLGELRIALVKGNDGEVPSQVSLYARAHGDGIVQHMAIRVDDLDAAVADLTARGVRFSGAIKDSRDGFGPMRQIFTEPVYPGGPFIEWIQRKVGDESEAQGFSDDTVRSLYVDVEAAQLSDELRIMLPALGLPPTERQVL
jgi:methylmalonyl-CoA/ethylmalonyl-CoA epimerase